MAENEIGVRFREVYGARVSRMMIAIEHLTVAEAAVQEISRRTGVPVVGMPGRAAELQRRLDSLGDLRRDCRWVELAADTGRLETDITRTIEGLKSALAR